MKILKINKKSLLKGLRDAAILVLAIYGISLWQARHLLDDDGSVEINDLQLVSVQGNVTPVFEQNKRTLLYFFAPWCSICEVSINNLDYLDDPNLRIVKIALDYQNQNAVEQFVSENDVGGNILMGSAQLKQQFNIPGYPTYYLLDENQTVVGHSFGYSTVLGLKLKNYLNK